MIIKTGRFGEITIENGEIIQIPQGILGFPEYTQYCLVDPGDETLILWLQSLSNPAIAFPVLEPKIFKPDYSVRLSASELKELQLENVNQSAVFSILTIADDVTLMTANLKAPLVINLREQLGKQVVLQENEYSIKQDMFKELRAHLITIESQKKIAGKEERTASIEAAQTHPIPVKNIPPSLTVKGF